MDLPADLATALTQAIAAETLGTGVTANCVLPSVIDTPANQRAMPNADQTHWVKPASLAGVITFLASDAARDQRGTIRKARPKRRPSFRSGLSYRADRSDQSQTSMRR